MCRIDFSLATSCMAFYNPECQILYVVFPGSVDSYAFKLKHLLIVLGTQRRILPWREQPHITMDDIDGKIR